MHDRVYFTREEAQASVGLEVEALASFPSVPKGTSGEVVKASRYAGSDYIVEVRWKLSRPSELIDLTIPDFSFNFFRTRKPVKDEFCKSAFAELVQIVRAARWT